MVAPKKTAAPATQGFNFGDLNAYSSGGYLPEGDYILADLTLKMNQLTKKDGSSAGPARLSVMITFKPMGGGEDIVQGYSLGGKAHESWQPDADTGKRLVPVPGGPGTPPNSSTNWAVFVKSLFDSGLPQGILQDDLGVLEGTWVHMALVPEPEERKGFVSQTGEAGVSNAPRQIAVVTEIKDDGKPWEGTGGIPAEVPAPKAKPNGKPGQAHVAAKPAPAPAPAAEDNGVEEAAINGISEVLGKNPNGCAKLLLRTSVFKSINASSGPEAAQAVMNEYFVSDAKLATILGPLGYQVKGLQVVAA